MTLTESSFVPLGLPSQFLSLTRFIVFFSGDFSSYLSVLYLCFFAFLSFLSFSFKSLNNHDSELLRFSVVLFLFSFKRLLCSLNWT